MPSENSIVRRRPYVCRVGCVNVNLFNAWMNMKASSSAQCVHAFLSKRRESWQNGVAMLCHLVCVCVHHKHRPHLFDEVNIFHSTREPNEVMTANFVISLKRCVAAATVDPSILTLCNFAIQTPLLLFSPSTKCTRILRLLFYIFIMEWCWCIRRQKNEWNETNRTKNQCSGRAERTRSSHTAAETKESAMHEIQWNVTCSTRRSHRNSNVSFRIHTASSLRFQMLRVYVCLCVCFNTF